ncbi:MAG TPA: SDR family oxidoreductase [Polyangia bacterium]|jgi:NAD(P)-dependent dehydrogenase (short-subunit alcohol dehydrogenase family)|nr:SDR family oxidoreductase [Polyangia bacterium]
MRYLVTGANRGIGLEFVRQLAARGDTVEAVARRPERSPLLLELAQRSPALVRLHTADVTNDYNVRALAGEFEGVGIDVLVNNAGVMGRLAPLAEIDLEDVMHTFAVNAVSPLRLARALLPALRRGQARRIVHITSKMGSIDDNKSGGAYGYRMSKAALNMASRSLANDLRGEEMVSAVLHPGWVKTDMGGPGAMISTEESVRGLLRVMDGLTLAHSGRFFSYAGEEVPW